jgi:hypothetical protein
MWILLQIEIDHGYYDNSATVDKVKYIKSFTTESEAKEYHQNINNTYREQARNQYEYNQNYLKKLVVPANVAGFFTKSELFNKIREGKFKVDDYRPPSITVQQVDTDDWHLVEIP